MVVFLAPAGGPNFDPFFTIFCKSFLNMPKNIILKNQKNLFTRKISKSEKLRKWPKKGQKWPFFGPGGSNFDPFFTIFCKSLLNMPKNIILKNQKNSFTRKISKTEKVRKWPKKGQKWPFFGPGGPNFAKIKKRLGHSLTFTPERLYTKFQKIWLIRLGENALQTDERTNERTGLKS